MEEIRGVYKPLDETHKQIRVMKIHANSSPSSTETVIVCSLEAVNLQDANPFYALSYVWGPAHPEIPILVDGQIMHVRQNLWFFLHALQARFCRQPDDTIRVWTDYICIQQSNLHELSCQVSMMGDIYQAADAVYAWLGMPPGPEDDDMKCIEAIRQMRQQNRAWVDISHERQPTFQHIASSTYWTRLWIKQEVILSKDTWFFYGPDVAHWKDVRFAAGLKQDIVKRSPRRRMSERADEEERGADLMRSLLSLRALRSSDVDLPELVTRFRSAHCQNAKDRIYAMLSLTHQETREQIVVDYDKPLLQMLLETYHLWTGERLALSSVDSASGLVPVYQFGSFCSQLAQLLPAAELLLLLRSRSLRSAITAQGVFTISTLKIISVSLCAVIDGFTVRSETEVDQGSSESRGFVLRVIVSALTARHSRYQREHFVYATEVPTGAEFLGRMGTREFFFGIQSPRCLTLITTGSEAQMVSLHNSDSRLSTQLLQHPCLWLRQQVPDALFQVVDENSWTSSRPRGSKKDTSDVAILSNAAGIVTLLAESRAFKKIDSRAVNKPGQANASDAGTQAGADATSELPDQWSPFVFGVQHKLLIPCRICLTVDMEPSTLQRPQPNDLANEECQCRWVSQPT